MNYAKEVWGTTSPWIKFHVFYSFFYFNFCTYLVPHLDIFNMYLDIWDVLHDTIYCLFFFYIIYTIMLIKIDKIIESHEHLPEQNVLKNIFFIMANKKVLLSF